MNIYEFGNYREYLKCVLSKKMEKNPTFSLRAMARQIGVSPATLSEAISGKANLSASSARKIAQALKLKAEEKNYLCELVQLMTEKDPDAREHILKRIKLTYSQAVEEQDLSVEYFRQISDWYHSAILELAMLDDFEFTSENIAKVLEIPKPSAEIAVERLIKLGLMEWDKSGKIKRNHPNLVVTSDVKNAAMRSYYRQMLEKINVALEEQTPKERLSSYYNLPLNPEALPEISQAIRRFFSEISTITEKHKNKKKVYHLSLHFIDLLTGDKK